MLFTAEVRNYGPGYLKSLDLYLAIPENSFHQTLLTEPVYSSEARPKHITDKWGQNFASFHFDNLPAGGKAFSEHGVKLTQYPVGLGVVHPDARLPEQVEGVVHQPKLQGRPAEHRQQELE